MALRYGGDYNPEQWSEAVWSEDVALMAEAGVNLVTLGVFAWARLEPRPGEFDFAWLDRIIEQLHAAGIRIDLATATASPPPWLTHLHPEVLPVTREGVRLVAGSRQHTCPSSLVHRDLAARLVEALVGRYGSHPAIEMWHVGNELGNHVSHCYCDVSAAAFRAWLEQRYGTIDELNASWATAFWSQQYTGFHEISPPSAMPTFPNPGQLLDFDRFTSDELLAAYESEAAVIRRGAPGIPVTTNFMGFFRPADYWAWAPSMDLIADDSYPDPLDPDAAARAAMQRDLVRSLGGGRPWLLMEQSTGAVNWRVRNAAKRIGQYRAWSYQAIARGADGVLQFQWRQSSAGAERFHSAMVPHAGRDSRIWRDVVRLGAELRRLDRVEGTTVPARVAIVFDWTVWWSLDQPDLPIDVDYPEAVFGWYRELYRNHIVVDFVSADGPFDQYDAVIAPHLFVATDSQLHALDGYVQQGGRLLVTYLSGIVDDRGHAGSDRYLGPLTTTLGVRVEEFAPLAAADPVLLRSREEQPGQGTGWREYIQARDAAILWTFDDGDLAGLPAVTRAIRGSGTAWYVATTLAGATFAEVVRGFLTDSGVRGPLDVPISGVDVVERGGLTFVVSTRDSAVTVPLGGHDLLGGADAESFELAPYGVLVLDRGRDRSATVAAGDRRRGT